MVRKMYVTLKDKMSEKSHNLQFLKFMAAILVIVSHAYPITQGNNEMEPLLKLTRGQLSFGGLAVGVFFFTAGLFIAKSAEQKKDAKHFFVARCKRIFPALLLTVVLTMILGGFVTSLSLKAYLLSAGTWKYLWNGALIPVHNLPGVFEKQPYLPTVNGALWTLPLEFGCYVGCFIAYKLGFLQKKRGIVTGVIVVVSVAGSIAIQNSMPGMVNVTRPCLLFGIGMFYFIYREKIRIGWQGALLGSLLFLMSLVFGVANIGMYLFLPYALINIAYLKVQLPTWLASVGNWSYGIYLCGFPIQQTVCYLYLKNHAVDAILPGEILAMTPGQNMMFAIPMACVVGFLIYLVAERA